MRDISINWEKLGLSNDFIFGKVMRNPGLCKEMLELILGIEIGHLEYPEGQKDINEDLKAFLDYVGGRKSDTPYIRKLEKEIKKAKQNREWRREYMTLLMRDKENIEKGIQQGRQEGENRLARLTKKLVKDRRYDDIEAIEDINYREKLYEEYHIV